MKHILKKIVWLPLGPLREVCLLVKLMNLRLQVQFPQGPISFTVFRSKSLYLWPWPALLPNPTIDLKSLETVEWWSPIHSQYWGKNINKCFQGIIMGHMYHLPVEYHLGLYICFEICLFIIFRGILISSLVKELQWMITAIFPHSRSFNIEPGCPFPP